MTINIRYRKNLNMSRGKLAAQCVHAVLMLDHASYTEPVIVLGVSDIQFDLCKNYYKVHVVRDAGLTEVPPNTETVLAWREEEQESTR
jgi:peptidyl-tRNA hydrolase